MEQSFYCYVVFTDTGGAIIHQKGCRQLRISKSRLFLGSVYQSHQAINLAKRHSPNVYLCSACMDTDVSLSDSSSE